MGNSLILEGSWGQAGSCYDAAVQLRATSHAALYNWGVALSDMARVQRSTDPAAATDYLISAADKYAASLQWNPQHPQVCRRGHAHPPAWLCLAPLSSLHSVSMRCHLCNLCQCHTPVGAWFGHSSISAGVGVCGVCVLVRAVWD